MAPSQKKKKPENKRSSLRDRNSVTKPSRLEDSSPESSPRKKKTTSIVVATTYGTATGGQPAKRRKAWLNEALFAGQNATGNLHLGPTGKMRKKKTGLGDEGRTFMPMPWHDYLDKIQRPFTLPWDVYSPLPKGQPKPDEWRKTRASKIPSKGPPSSTIVTNMSEDQFVGDAREEWQHRKPAAPSQCVCIGNCGEQCLNRIMNYECDSDNCNIGPECGNRSFADLRERVKSGKKYHIGVEVVQTGGKGFGVRAARSFEPGQIIVEYSGEVITRDECNRRLRNEYKQSQAYYLMAFDQAMIIDATKGSIARFINHSCAPNCTMDQWIVKGKPRMALFAGEKGIMTGEELTYDYNYDSFAKKPMACLCGASRCRGVLGPKLSKQEEKEMESKTLAESIASVTSTLKRKANDLLGNGSKRIKSNSSTTSSPKKPKARRQSEPIPRLLKQAAGNVRRPPQGKKAKRVSSAASKRTLVDKENATPSSRSSSTNSSGRNSAKHSESAQMQSTLKGWLKGSLASRKLATPTSIIAKAMGRGRRPVIPREQLTEEQRAAADKREEYKAEKERKLANPTPGSRGSKRLSVMDAIDVQADQETKDDKEWKSFGKSGGKGKWTYELVPREEKKSRLSL